MFFILFQHLYYTFKSVKDTSTWVEENWEGRVRAGLGKVGEDNKTRCTLFFIRLSCLFVYSITVFFVTTQSDIMKIHLHIV